MRCLPLLRLGSLAGALVLALAGCSTTREAEPAIPGSATARDRTFGLDSSAGLESVAPARPPTDGKRNAYVLLSGGGTPLSNHYSQFLQARAITEFFERECRPEESWVFFGIGNRPDRPPLLADAHREVRRDGRLIDTWEVGALPRNRPATRESFLRALREEILPTVRNGGTLYLFVGDHGEVTGADGSRESAITLWQLKPRPNGGWREDNREVLGVAELRRVLTEGLGAGRVVFGMTQCHGGGFHELGLAREMAPPRTWFETAPPAWAVGESRGVRWPIAGFTATDMASPAAGCDADPDPDRWAGYERFLPESLLGRDLMSGRSKGAAAVSFAEAHEAATLVDRTIDKPRATSEHYLDAWAKLIETRLASATDLTAEVRAAVAGYRRAVEHGRSSGGVDDAAWRMRASQYERFTQQLGAQAPAAREMVLQGTRAQLEQAIRPGGARGGGSGAVAGRGARRGEMTELRRRWSDTLRPAWQAAVRRGKVPGLSGAVLAFEQRLLKLEQDGRDFLLPRGGDTTALLEQVYWASGYDEPAKLDRAKAEAIARWADERRDRIIAWGESVTDPAVRAAATRIGRSPSVAEEPPKALSRKTAAERTLYYRRVLAAWEFLLAVRAESALAELHTLLELERTPLRASRARMGE